MTMWTLQWNVSMADGCAFSAVRSSSISIATGDVWLRGVFAIPK